MALKKRPIVGPPTASMTSLKSCPTVSTVVCAPFLLSQTATGKIVTGLALKYPDVRLETTTEDRAVDRIEEGYDLAIRVNPTPDESLSGVELFRMTVSLTCTSGSLPPRLGLARSGRRPGRSKSGDLECHDVRRPC